MNKMLINFINVVVFLITISLLPWIGPFSVLFLADCHAQAVGNSSVEKKPVNLDPHKKFISKQQKKIDRRVQKLKKELELVTEQERRVGELMKRSVVYCSQYRTDENRKACLSKRQEEEYNKIRSLLDTKQRAIFIAKGKMFGRKDPLPAEDLDWRGGF